MRASKVSVGSNSCDMSTKVGSGRLHLPADRLKGVKVTQARS